MITVDVTHRDLPDNRWPGKNFALAATAAEAKEQLYIMTGSEPSAQRLTLHNDTLGRQVPWNEGTLQAAVGGPTDGWTLEVEDTDPESITKQLSKGASSDVPKYRMSDADYARRNVSARQWIKQLKQSRPELFIDENAEAAAPTGDPGVAPEEVLEKLRAKVAVGDRCEGLGGNRGTVKWMGVLDRGAGAAVYVGVLLDEPCGDWDGCHRNARLVAGAEGPRDAQLYTAQQRDGKVGVCGLRVGDFPPRDPFQEDEEEF